MNEQIIANISSHRKPAERCAAQVTSASGGRVQGWLNAAPTPASYGREGSCLYRLTSVGIGVCVCVCGHDKPSVQLAMSTRRGSV
jgi:hypothetical protein